MTTTAATHATALQVRFDHLIRQMRLVEAQTPAVARSTTNTGGGATVTGSPTPRPAASLHNLVRANGSRHAAKQHDGQRHCPMHDDGKGAWLPVSAFKVKNQATGALRSWCDDCTKAYQRARYVSTTAKTMTVELIEGDKCVGHDCPVCGLPFEIGERITGEDLHHA